MGGVEKVAVNDFLKKKLTCHCHLSKDKILKDAKESHVPNRAATQQTVAS